MVKPEEMARRRDGCISLEALARVRDRVTSAPVSDGPRVAAGREDLDAGLELADVLLLAQAELSLGNPVGRGRFKDNGLVRADSGGPNRALSRERVK